jgi:hypothetical protein
LVTREAKPSGRRHVKPIRVNKRVWYQRIASLADYLLVSQIEPRIEHYRRAADGSWTYRAVGSGERVTLSTDAMLIVDEIYAGVFELPGD